MEEIVYENRGELRHILYEYLFILSNFSKLVHDMHADRFSEFVYSVRYAELFYKEKGLPEVLCHGTMLHVVYEPYREVIRFSLHNDKSCSVELPITTQCMLIVYRHGMQDHAVISVVSKELRFRIEVKLDIPYSMLF